MIEIGPVGAIVAIALNTFREAVRDRVLYLMLLFAVGLILFSLVLGQIAPREQLRLTIDVGLGGVSLMSVLVAIVLGGANLYKEIERKTVYFILPQPIARWQFLVGKFLGLAWVLLISIAVMGGTLLTVVSWNDPFQHLWVGLVGILDLIVVLGLVVLLRRRPALWPALLAVWMLATGSLLAYRAQADLALIFQGLALVASEAIVVSSVALLFSSFSTPFLSGVLTFLVFIAGRELQWLETLAERIRSDGVDLLVHGVEIIFPNTYLFVPSVNVLEGRFVVADMPNAPWMFVAHAAGYGLLYSLIILVIAGFVLWRRDFV